MASRRNETARILKRRQTYASAAASRAQSHRNELERWLAARALRLAQQRLPRVPTGEDQPPPAAA